MNNHLMRAFAVVSTLFFSSTHVSAQENFIPTNNRLSLFWVTNVIDYCNRQTCPHVDLRSGSTLLRFSSNTYTGAILMAFQYARDNEMTIDNHDSEKHVLSDNADFIDAFRP